MDIPLYVYVIDYVLGAIMYTLIGRSAMNIFQKEDSEFFFMKVFVQLTNSILNFFRIGNIVFKFDLSETEMIALLTLFKFIS